MAKVVTNYFRKINMFTKYNIYILLFREVHYIFSCSKIIQYVSLFYSNVLLEECALRIERDYINFILSLSLFTNTFT